MKNIHYLLGLFFVVALGLASSDSHPVQGTAGYTSAPGDSFCSQCHNPNASINGTVAVTGLPSEIVPGQLYNLTVTLTRTAGSATRGGFQLLVLNGNNQNSGSLQNVETDTSVKTVSGGKKYAGHEPYRTFPGSGIITWQVDWQAPPTNATGQAKFYVAGMLANGNGGNSGDRAVAFNLIVPFQSSNPDPINLTITNVTNPSCFDTEDGTATVNITGGTPPYNILWNNGETTATALALPGGMAVVTVTDAAAASSSRSTTLVSPSPITLNVTTTDASCFGDDDGSASATATGGTGSKTFSWSNGGSGPSQFNLAAGTYSVTATDSNGCEETTSFSIESPPQILINVISINNPFCFGQQNGSIEVEAEGGAGNFEYNWSNGGNGPAITDVGAGMYTVTVTDANDCTSSSSYSLVQPQPINVSFPSVNNVTCFGANNGAITAQASGGNGNFTYIWSNGATGSTIQNLAPGTYTVTAVDVEGCEGTNTVSITQPLPISVQLVQNIPASCSGAADGGLVVEASGTFTNFSFVWSNGTTTAANLNIPAGMYTVTVTDPALCTQTASFTVGTNAPFVLSLGQSSDVSCFGLSDGSIEVNVNPPGNYTYAWSNGATGNQLTNLSAGTYICTASDASGCESSPLTVVISQPLAIESSFAILEIIECYGDEDGRIAVTASGGSGSFSYLWNTGETSDTLSGIAAGNYVLTITDSDDCSVAEAVFLSQPDSLQIQLLVNDSLACFGDNDGLLAIAVNGGTGEKVINWSNGDSTLVIGSLTAGQYSVIIEDERACTVTDTFIVYQPSGIIITAEIGNVNPANGNDGFISADVSGGTGNLSLLWSNGETGQTIDSLTVGQYNLTVTDENGCSVESSYFVAVLDCALTAQIETTDATCSGGDDGTITINVANPIGQYTAILWLDTLVIDTASYDQLTAGIYRLQVIDSAFCSIEFDSIVIGEGVPITVTGTITHPTTGQSNGSIDAEASGGAGVLTYAWFSNFGQLIGEGRRIENLMQGFYFLLVTDSLGCQKMQNFILQDKVASKDEEIVSGLVVYPNPGDGRFTIKWAKPVYCSEIILRNSLGQPGLNMPFGYSADTFTLDGSLLPSGLWLAEIKLLNKTIFVKLQIQK